MSKQVARIALGTALAIAAPAWSADTPAERGWSLEANVFEVQSSEGEKPFAFDGEENGVALAGGYSFTKHLGVQADFRLSSYEDTDSGALVAGVGIWATPRWRMNVQVERADFDLESAGVGMTYRF